MRAFYLALMITTFLCCSCVRRYSDATPYQISGRQKPVVAVLPVIDHTSDQDLTWNLAREFTEEIRKRVYDSKNIYLLREGSSLETARALSTPNPKSIDRLTIEDLGATQFVVVTEILQQEELPFSQSKHSKLFHLEGAAVLSLTLKVRVLDIRHRIPKIVLQEVLEDDYVVAKSQLQNDYTKTPWGSEAFTRTPMGMAHNRLVKGLVARVEAYIEAAQ